jgi:hypothetical protein
VQRLCWLHFVVRQYMPCGDKMPSGLHLDVGSVMTVRRNGQSRLYPLVRQECHPEYNCYIAFAFPIEACLIPL